MREYGDVPPLTAAGPWANRPLPAESFSQCFHGELGWRRAGSAAFRMCAAPLLWVALEFLRAHICRSSAFPGIWRATQPAAALRSCNSLTLSGICGLSFLVAALWGAACVRNPFGHGSAHGRFCSSVTAARSSWSLVGNYFVPRVQSRYVAHLVQTNFPAIR